MPPEENCPTVRVGVWVKVRVSFRVGEQPDNCPEENRVRVWLKVSFGVGGQFSSSAIALEPFRNGSHMCQCFCKKKNE